MPGRAGPPRPALTTFFRREAILPLLFHTPPAPPFGGKVGGSGRVRPTGRIGGRGEADHALPTSSSPTFRPPTLRPPTCSQLSHRNTETPLHPPSLPSVTSCKKIQSSIVPAPRPLATLAVQIRYRSPTCPGSAFEKLKAPPLHSL